MHFAYNSLVAIIAVANSVDGGNSSRRTVAETSAQLQFTEESAGDFILNHFRSSDPAANNIEFRNIVASFEPRMSQALHKRTRARNP